MGSSPSWCLSPKARPASRAGCPGGGVCTVELALSPLFAGDTSADSGARNKGTGADVSLPLFAFYERAS